MLKNYVKIAFRNLYRFKGYALINILGLSFGLCISLLIMLFVIDELSFDQFHDNSDRIYRVVSRTAGGGGMETNAWPVGRLLQDQYPEVESAAYIMNAGAGMLVKDGNKRYPHNLFYADNNFFSMFSFEFIEGNGQSALNRPFSIVLTEAMKERYFQSRPALGEILTLQDSLEFEVTGVIRDIPSNSHIQFDALMSFVTFETMTDFSYADGWGNFQVRNYILLTEDASIDGLRNKAQNIYREEVGEMMKQLGVDIYVDFEPLADIYLKSNFGNGFGPSSSLDRVYLVSAIALFVLMLACINYVNLSTARSVYRAREVGMRKIVGSTRSAIFWQFQVEVFLVTLLSFILVFFLMELALPYFNQLMGKQFTIASFFSAEMISGVSALIILITFFAGIYPSLVLSRYKPTEVLKSKTGSSAKGVNLRRALVTFQFAVSGGLVMATLVIIGQLKYMQEQNLGFDKEHVVTIDLTRVPSKFRRNFIEELKNQSAVEAVTFTNAVPGRPGWQGQWAYDEELGEDAPQVDSEYMSVDENYIDVLGLELIAGRNFSPDRTSDIDDALIINETLVKEMNWGSPEEALGKRITSPSTTPAGEVIGVVKDYHEQGLQERIWPVAMDYAPRWSRYAAVRYGNADVSDLMDQTRGVWDETIGDYTFEYFFLDQEFDKQYHSEERLMKVFVLFAILTILIAVIGLLGLVSFMVISRTREIGIRKILGANETSLVTMLSKEFMFLVFLANLVIAPVVWYFGRSWLSEFAYHTTINPLLFLISLLVSALLAFSVVGIQTFLAARQNPVKVLRNAG